MAKKEVRTKVYLQCSTCKNKNYTTSKNTLNSKDKLSLQKYCSTCQQHTSHTEVKK